MLDSVTSWKELAGLIRKDVAWRYVRHIHMGCLCGGMHIHGVYMRVLRSQTQGRGLEVNKYVQTFVDRYTIDRYAIDHVWEKNNQGLHWQQIQWVILMPRATETRGYSAHFRQPGGKAEDAESQCDRLLIILK